MTDFKDFKSSISGDDLAKLVDESINPFKNEDGAINFKDIGIALSTSSTVMTFRLLERYHEWLVSNFEIASKNQ